MKNTFTLFILIFVVSINLFPQGIQLKSVNEEEPPVYVLDSSYTYKFNSETDSVLQDKKAYSYNSAGYDTCLIGLTYNFDTITSGQKSIKTKDSKGNITQEVSFQYNKGNWSKTADNNYYFNNDEITDSILYHWFDVTTGLTKKIFKDISYNSDNKTDSIIRLDWNEAKNMWINSKRFIWQYISDNNINIQYNWDTVSSSWINNSRTEKYYNINGYDSSWHILTWNKDSADWIYNYIYSFNYDINGKLLMGKNKTYIAAEDKWYCYDSTVYIYNSHGQNTSATGYMESPGVDLFLRSYYEYFYDTIGNKILDIGYSGIGVDKEVNTKTYSYFSQLTTNNNPNSINQKATSTLTYYPNPAKDKIYLNMKGENIEVSVYSVQGALICHKDATNGMIDISELANGMYLMKVVHGNQSLGTIRVIKQ